MTVSEFEKKRQENISRNKELFKKLNLDAVSSDFHRGMPRVKTEGEGPQKKRKRAASKPKKREVSPERPTRRSARLAGVKLEETDEGKFLKQMEKEKEEREERERLKSMRLSGDLKLSDVMDGENGEASLARIAKLGKISMGDFYEAVKSKPADKKTSQLRDELEELTLYERFVPNEIKLTTTRMTAITFHPTTSKKIIIGGDTMGEMGIWTPEDDDDNAGPDITHFKFHGKNIPRFEIRAELPQEVVSCSYDGSVRVLDMEKRISSSVLEFDDAWGDASGISDIHFIDQNVCYFTTLGGEFSTFDLREKNNSRESLQVLRLHDKKIGSFAVNPSFNKQIVTASLDRSMRIWDLRKTGPSTWSDFEEQQSPHCIGSYHSRLSVSTADWNATNDIVCNGYDNTINVFQLGGQVTDKEDYVIEPILEESLEGLEDIPINLKPTNTIKHNCQTGRWVSILKARWQTHPRDGVQKFVIANMNRYLDVFDRNGTQVAHLGDENQTSVPAVTCFHPTENWIVGGNASGKTMLWT